MQLTSAILATILATASAEARCPVTCFMAPDVGRGNKFLHVMASAPGGIGPDGVFEGISFGRGLSE
jgi:hypothetical protein